MHSTGRRCTARPRGAARAAAPGTRTTRRGPRAGAWRTPFPLAFRPAEHRAPPGRNLLARHGRRGRPERDRDMTRTLPRSVPAMRRRALPQPPLSVLMSEARTIPEFFGFLFASPTLSLTPTGDGHPVLVLPPFGSDDHATA